jgi:DNA polymerase-3 subunit delta'
VSFDRIYGQDRAISVLRAAMAAERIAPAYLFVGPPGVGKYLTAREFVKALNCERGDGDGCDQCANCRLVERDELPDLYEPGGGSKRIGKTATTGEKGRGSLGEIVSRLHYPAMMGRHKVVILDPADGLTPEAGNMLLKTLEEPPSATLFILVTTLESSVLPTLVSRCQRLRFPPLPAACVADFLVERRDLPRPLAEGLAAASEGSIARALELNESKVLEQRLEVVDFLLTLGRVPLADRVEGALAMLQTLDSKEREAVQKLATVATLFSRDVLSSACRCDPSTLLFRERADEIGRLAVHIGRRGALRLAELMRELAGGLGRNENPKNLLYYLGNEMASLVREEPPQADRRPHA